MNLIRKVERRLLESHHKSISRQFLTAIILISSVVTLFVAAVQLAYDYDADVKTIQGQLELVEKGYSKSLAKSLWDLDDLQIRSELEGILTVPGIRYVKITDGSKIVSQMGSPPSGKTLDRSFPLFHQVIHENGTENIPLGEMTLVANLDEVRSRARNRILFVFFTELLKVAVVAAVIFLIARHLLTRHLIAITHYLEGLDFRSRNPDLKLDRTSRPELESGSTPGDELDTLTLVINRMKSDLYRSYTELTTFAQQLEKKVSENTSLILDQRQKLEYSAKMSALGQMAGGMAHEINNPLAVISMNAEFMKTLLETGKYDPQVFGKLLESIAQTSHRIAGIVKGLRMFARGGENDPLIPTSLRGILDDTLMLSAERLKALRIQLRITEIPHDLLIECNGVQISQVLLNLINNAADAIGEDEASVERWIQIDFENLGSEIMLSVMDSGSGIAKEIQEKVMQPFFTTKQVGQGTGLGLSISSGIIQAHHGELSIDWKSSKTRFVIRLPVRQPPPH